jgi:N-acyl homoserine lactone hydrolase
MQLYILQLGLWPEGDVPIPGYLIKTDDGVNVLVDTGLPPTYVNAYQNQTEMTFHVTEADDVGNRLAEIEVTPQDIDYLVCTHFDLDHCGNHGRFPQAKLIVQKQLYEAACSGEIQRLNDTRSYWDAPQLTYHLIEGDVRLLPGIELIETDGHNPGHQSLLVRLPQTGPVLLTIDAVRRQVLFDQNAEATGIQTFHMDEEAARNSTQKLIKRAEQENVNLVVFGHDGDQWKTLRKSPDFYA